MTILESVLLGIVQGLTEFLPVSSSGHLTLGQHLLGLRSHNLSFDIAVHFGTLLSVLTVYRKVVIQIAAEVLGFAQTRKVTPGVRLFALMFIGSLPAAVAGIGFKDFFADMFTSLNVVATGFVITGVLLYLTRFKNSGEMGSHFAEKIENADHISFLQALLIGAAQALAITPGISRAGATIAAGLLMGLDRSSAALMSFMLAIPAIFGASLLELRNLTALSSGELTTFVVGILVAYATGVIGLKVVLTFVQKGRVHLFSFYVWILALFTFFWV